MVESQILAESTVVLGFPLAVTIASRALCVFACLNHYVEVSSDEYIPDGVGFVGKKKSNRYTTMRITECDDCEGKAEEIMFEFIELISTRENRGWKTRIVQCFADFGTTCP
jgi:hypothetical protein